MSLVLSTLLVKSLLLVLLLLPLLLVYLLTFCKVELQEHFTKSLSLYPNAIHWCLYVYTYICLYCAKWRRIPKKREREKTVNRRGWLRFFGWTTPWISNAFFSSFGYHWDFEVIRPQDPYYHAVFITICQKGPTL